MRQPTSFPALLAGSTVRVGIGGAVLAAATVAAHVTATTSPERPLPRVAANRPQLTRSLSEANPDCRPVAVWNRRHPGQPAPASVLLTDVRNRTSRVPFDLAWQRTHTPGATQTWVVAACSRTRAS